MFSDTLLPQRSMATSVRQAARKYARLVYCHLPGRVHSIGSKPRKPGNPCAATVQTDALWTLSLGRDAHSVKIQEASITTTATFLAARLQLMTMSAGQIRRTRCTAMSCLDRECGNQILIKDQMLQKAA